MQHADGMAEVQALSQPTRRRCPRVQMEPIRFVPCANGLYRIAAHLRTTRDIW